MIIIGLSGRKRSGKDTVCEIIQKICPGAKRFAFADALKRELSEATGTPISVIEKEKDRFRLGLQWWGSEFRRGQCETYWVDQVVSAIDKAKEGGCPIAVITDCRFQNEGDAVREMGGSVIRIERANPSGDCHQSETAMDNYNFDYVICNRGSLQDLEREVCQLVSALHVPDVIFGGTNMSAESGLATCRPEAQAA
jgi:hypothetical protein